MAGAASVELACVLRTVRAWSEPWADDPLPGTYYVRLTVLKLSADDLGKPVDAELRVESKDMGGAAAVDGSLSEPLVPGIASRPEEESDDTSSAVLAGLEPEDGWTSGWWSDRWIWTAAAWHTGRPGGRPRLPPDPGAGASAARPAGGVTSRLSLVGRPALCGPSGC